MVRRLPAGDVPFSVTRCGMNLTVSGKQIDVGDSLRAHVERELVQVLLNPPLHDIPQTTAHHGPTVVVVVQRGIQIPQL